MRAIVAFALTSAVLVACSPKDNSTAVDTTKAATAAAAFDKGAAEAEIRSGDSTFFAGVKNKDGNMIASTYSDDAVSMPPNSPQLEGHDAIKKFNDDMLKLPNFTMTGETKSVKFSDDGTMAYVVGTYHATWNDAKGKPAAEDGKYINVEQKVGGKWKVVADAYSSNSTPKM